MQKIPRLKMIQRDDWLTDVCCGKRVLHVGCTDHPMTTSKIENNRLLHARLVQVATEVIGLDIDKEGIETLSSLMPEQKFLVQNAEALDQCEALAGQKFDVIVAADVIEHVSNIGLFLAGIRNKLNPGGQLLITTPQAFAIKRMMAMILLSYEYVHPDHIAYFSVSTLSRILSRYALEVEQAYMFQWQNPTFKNWLANSLLMPFLSLSGGRLCDEMAVIVKIVQG